MSQQQTPDPLDALDLDTATRTQLRTSMEQYGRHARLRLSVDSVNGKVVWCTAHQSEAAPNGRVLTEAEIVDRAMEAFAGLRTAGYEAIISVVPVGKGTAERLIAKHRIAPDAVVQGREGMVLRQARPRMLFAMERGELQLLALEDAAQEGKVKICAPKAAEWLKRAHYRDR